MSEPTAEQVDRERERAHVVLRAIFNNEDGPWQCALKDRTHDEDCDVIATALARVRKEAHAAGRDEGLRDAEEAATRQCCDCRNESGVHGEWCHGHLCGGAIRALRVRT